MFLILLRIFFFLFHMTFIYLFMYDILCNDDIKLKNVNILILICTN